MTEGVIASGMTMVIITLVGYIFALGNSRQRSKKPGMLSRLKELGRRCIGKGKKKDDADKPLPQAPEGFIFVEQKRWTTLGKICFTVGFFAFPFNLLALPFAKEKRRVLISLEEADAAARRAIQDAEPGVSADGQPSDGADGGSGVGLRGASSGVGSSIEVEAKAEEAETVAELQAKRNAAEFNRMRNMGACESAEDVQAFLEMKKLEDQMANIARDQTLDEKVEASTPKTGKARLKLNLKKKSKPQITSFEIVLIQAQIEKKRRDLGWRTDREYKARLSLAWAVNMVIIPALLLTYSIACAVSLGETETNMMCISWLVAYAVTFAIVEPVQVLLLAGSPWLCDEDSRVGRCCARVRYVYNELLAP